MPDDLPSIELLESTHSFPCPFTFKVIGEADEQFIGRVVSVVRSEISADEEPAFSSRRTTSGRHMSVTIEPIMVNAEHVLTIYRRLREVEGVVMVF